MDSITRAIDTVEALIETLDEERRMVGGADSPDLVHAWNVLEALRVVAADKCAGPSLIAAVDAIVVLVPQADETLDELLARPAPAKPCCSRFKFVGRHDRGCQGARGG